MKGKILSNSLKSRVNTETPEEMQKEKEGTLVLKQFVDRRNKRA